MALPTCIALSLYRLPARGIGFSGRHLKTRLCLERTKDFVPFRQIVRQSQSHARAGRRQKVVLVVRFRFTHLSHHANKVASLLPMPAITGFPGFASKLYAVHNVDGAWLRVYEWKFINHLRRYRNALVFRVMQKRVVADSLFIDAIDQKTLAEFVMEHSTGVEEAAV